MVQRQKMLHEHGAQAQQAAQAEIEAQLWQVACLPARQGHSAVWRLAALGMARRTAAQPVLHRQWEAHLLAHLQCLEHQLMVAHLSRCPWVEAV